MGAKLWLLLSVAYLLCIGNTVGDYPHNPFTATTSDDPTPYGPNGSSNDGDCQQDNTLGDYDYIAQTVPNTQNFDPNQCGMCYAVTGPKKNVTWVVRVIDWCRPSGCPQQWTLSKPAFLALGCTAGVCNITMQVTNCDVGNRYGGNIALWFAAQGPNYLYVNPVNILVRVVNMTVTTGGITYYMNHTDPYVGWKAHPINLQFPFTLNIYSTEGELVQYTLNTQPSSQLIQTNVQFTIGYGGVKVSNYGVTFSGPSSSSTSSSSSAASSLRSNLADFLLYYATTTSINIFCAPYPVSL